jgi:hypothetical protein
MGMNVKGGRSLWAQLNTIEKGMAMQAKQMQQILEMMESHFSHTRPNMQDVTTIYSPRINNAVSI